MKLKIFLVVLVAMFTTGMPILASAAPARQLQLLGVGWWVDTSSIEAVKQEDGSVMTLFYMVLEDKDGVPPDEIQQSITRQLEAVNCATGKLFRSEGNDWFYDKEKWSPEWRAAVKRVVCKQQDQ